MLAQLYQSIILKNPKSVFIFLIIILLSFGYHSKDFRLDASSETLLIEGDPDLKSLQEISKRYGFKDFFIFIFDVRTMSKVVKTNFGFFYTIF